MYRIYDCLDINEYALGRAINDEDEESAAFYEELFWEDSHPMWKLMKAVEFENNREEKKEKIWNHEDDE